MWEPIFNVYFATEVGAGSGLIAGIKTLNTGMLGLIIIAGIVLWIDNRFFDSKLLEFLRSFK